MGPGADFGTPLSPLDRFSSQVSNRQSAERVDYFSDAINSPDADANKPAQTPAAVAEPRPSEDKAGKTSTENGKEKEKEKDKDKEVKSPSTPFGKKFRMNMSFGGKKLGRSASNAVADKPAVVDEKAEESESSSNHEKEFADSFHGVIQKIHNEYDKQLTENPDMVVETHICPSLPNDTPVLKLPKGTKVIIQEETSGGSAELYRGTVESVGADVDVIEQKGPQWLGEVLLLNAIPPKDPVKVSFVLYPWQDTLPAITVADGNNRLNANRMLRVRKILAYVAERIDPPADPENPDPDAMKPEEYLELYCNEQVSLVKTPLPKLGCCCWCANVNNHQQLLPNTMSLATLRAHVWKGGNDIVLHYKANGKKEILFPSAPPPSVTDGGGQRQSQESPSTTGTAAAGGQGQIGQAVAAAA